MKKLNRISVLALCAASASPALASVVITPTFTTLSALKNQGNFSALATRYQADLNTDAGDPDVYINAMNFVPGAGWDSNINLTMPDPTSLRYNGGDYFLGTAITGDTHWHFDEILSKFGTVNSSVAPGIYNFSVDFVGGATSTATDTIASLNFSLEVANGLDITGTGSASPSTIAEGGVDTSTVSMTLTNNEAAGGRTYVVSTWFYNTNGDPTSFGHLTGNFIGNWFNVQLAPGDTVTDGHTTWTAPTGTAGVTYVGDLGITGGLYVGDNFDLTIHPDITVVSAPEPATMTLASLGAAMALGRRRR